MCTVRSLSRLTLSDTTDCSTPGSPVLHCLPELAQTLVHWVDDAIQPSHPLLPPALLHSIFPSIFLTEMSKSTGLETNRLVLNPSIAAYCVTLDSFLHVLKPHLTSVNDKNSTSRVAVRVTWLMFVDYVRHRAAVRNLDLLWFKSLNHYLCCTLSNCLSFLNTLPRWVSVKYFMPRQDAMLHPRSDQSREGRSWLLTVEMLCSLWRELKSQSVTTLSLCTSSVAIPLYPSRLLGSNRKYLELNYANQKNSQHTLEFLEDGDDTLKSSQIVPQRNKCPQAISIAKNTW